MKKFLVLSLALILSSTSCFAWGWKKKEQSKIDTSNIEVQAEGRGYKGTLPDVSKNFKTNEPKKSKPVFEDNPAFVNIILKEDKRSPYINELNSDVIPQLENLLLCIENKMDVQKFNAKVFFFTQTVEYMQNEYEGKPEINFVSFKKLQELGNHAKSVATLRQEAEKYKPYLAYTGAGYLYNENTINQQLDYLKTEIEETIVILKEAR